jgi:ATP-dependent DNA helicase RecG
MNLTALQSLIAQGESETLELKRSTAELKRAGETALRLLERRGWQGADRGQPRRQARRPGGRGHHAPRRRGDARPLRAAGARRAEPRDVGDGRQVIVLEAAPSRQFAPFVFESKPYKRVGSTTTVMSQEEYARLLLDRNHSRHRWENQPAVGVRLEDLDREEILRTRATAIEQRRLSAGTSMDVGDILDRLGLRIDGQVTQAAQTALRDEVPARLPAGAAQARALPRHEDHRRHPRQQAGVPARVRDGPRGDRVARPDAAAVRALPRGAINREDRLPVPAEALREIVINAVIHRDVSNPSSYVAIAVFDDRIEIHSIGDFPTGIRAELLTQEHRSMPRNPLIAGAFHRTGAIEVWGRGTNRVIETCRAHGIADPVVHRGLGRCHGDLFCGGGRRGMDGAVSQVWSQVGPKSRTKFKCSTLAEVRGALAELMGPLAEEQDAVPGPGRRPPARRRAARDDHPRQAAKLEAAIPGDGSGPRCATGRAAVVMVRRRVQGREEGAAQVGVRDRLGLREHARRLNRARRHAGR